jgi:phage-related minor tail protein
MDALLIIVWWIALIGALVLTVVAVLEISRVVHHLREIDRLAKVTLTAAGGIAGNTAILTALPDVLATAGRLGAGVTAIAGVSASIRAGVGRVAVVLGGQGGR